MAEAPDPDDDLNFSDIDSDDDDNDNAPSRPVIAHKNMANIDFEEDEEEGENDSSDNEDNTEFEPISPPMEDPEGGNTRDSVQDERDPFDIISPASPASPAASHTSEKPESNFDPISPTYEDEQDANAAVGVLHDLEDDDDDDNGPISPLPHEEPMSPMSPDPDAEDKFEPISPPNSPPATDTRQTASSGFENISDDEGDASENKKEGSVFEEGRFSPVEESDTELNFDGDESSNDSGYQLVQKHIPKSAATDQDDSVDLHQKLSEAVNDVKKDELDVDAPIPSPFSDIGDIDDITEQNESLITDIMKDKDGDEHFDLPGETLVESEEKEEAADGLSEKAENEESPSLPSVPVSPESGEIVTTTEVTEAPTVDESGDQQPGLFDDDADEGEMNQGEADVGGLIADIFGDSDDEEEEFEGFAEEELLPEKPRETFAPSDSEESQDELEKDDKENKKVAEKRKAESSDEEEIVVRSRDFVSDFDLMLEKKKEQNRLKRRRKKDVDIINDNDDIIAAMLKQMKDAAEEDRILNQCGKAATKKMKLLPSVNQHLQKADLQHTFIDCGVLPAMKDWLSPLPDNSLPHVNIRRAFLKLLFEFPPLDKGALKVSGIGRAVMLLYKHPKELVENRRLASKIIRNWSGPIFSVNTNFKDMSKEEREERDKMSISEKRRRLSSSEDKIADDDPARPRKPGDKGWVGRARVPLPSNKDYLNRPAPRIEGYDFGKAQKTKQLSRYEKQMRKVEEKRKAGLGGGNLKAVGISLNGSKMAL